jgi:hypothetical protein
VSGTAYLGQATSLVADGVIKSGAGIVLSTS